MRYIDLFCGIGSFHYSFSKKGWECVMACDIEKSCRDTYYENYGLYPDGDITEIDISTIPQYDILCAGFPCQPFSQCGKHQGFQDKRGILFYYILNFVTTHHPKIIILENVPGLLSHEKGETFEIITTEINKEGYFHLAKIIKCSDYGIPQMRKRLFLIFFNLNFFSEDLPFQEVFNFSSFLNKTNLSTFFGKKFDKETAYTIRCGGRNSPINGKHNWDGYLIDNQEYRLTLEDCLKLQGFDKNFKLVGSQKEKWKMVGNTIPTIFTKMIGDRIEFFLKLIEE